MTKSLATPMLINSDWPETVSEAVPTVTAGNAGRLACRVTPLVDVDNAPGMNWTVAIPLASVVVDPGDMLPLLRSDVAVKFTVTPDTGLPVASRTVAVKALWLVVAPAALGATAPGLACKSILVGTVAIKEADALVRAVEGAANCAETVTGPAVVELTDVVAHPTGMVCGTVTPTVVAVDAVSIPRVVLKVTVWPANPTPPTL